jgi:hypothetical protein
MCVLLSIAFLAVIFSVKNSKKDIKNTFDSETHIQTALPKRKCNRPRKQKKI